MTDQVFITQYRDEFIAGFEQHQSLLRDTVTTEAVIKGNQAVFLVADSGDAEASTRGNNGLITARSDNQAQSTATLNEWHDLVRKTDFNIFASQGNQRAIMQMTTMAVINRKIDQEIIGALNGTTVTIGSASTIFSVNLFQNGRVKLSNAEVPWDSNITLLCQPASVAYLELAPEFSSADYISMKPFAGDDASWRDQPMAYRWKSALILEHPKLPGKGTTSELNWLYHKNSVGHAANTAGMDNSVGYNDEQKYSYARCSMDMGSVLLQAAGAVEITSDGSAFA
jgi:hypothetical protein